jgi:hypothetical protein
LFKLIDPDLSTRKIKLYLFSISSGMPSSFSYPEVTSVLSDFLDWVKVGMKEAITAT